MRGVCGWEREEGVVDRLVQECGTQGIKKSPALSSCV